MKKKKKKVVDPFKAILFTLVVLGAKSKSRIGLSTHSSHDIE